MVQCSGNMQLRPCFVSYIKVSKDLKINCYQNTLQTLIHEVNICIHKLNKFFLEFQSQSACFRGPYFYSNIPIKHQEMLDQTYLYCRIISITIPGSLSEKLLSFKDVIFQAVTKHHLSFQGKNCKFFFAIVMNTLYSILSAGNKHKNGGFRTENGKLNIIFMQC